MGPESRRSPKTKPHLVIRIKEGWRFDEEERLFVSAERRVEVQGDLPRGSRIEYRAPQLAEASRSSLRAEELDLLRYFTVMLPSGCRPSDYVELVKRWPCVEYAEVGPEPHLPDQLGPAVQDGEHGSVEFQVQVEDLPAGRVDGGRRGGIHHPGHLHRAGPGDTE